MKNFRKNALTALLMTIFQLVTVSNAWADWNVTLENSYRQDRIDFHGEDLDRNNFVGGGYTSDWGAVKKISIYQIGLLGEVYDKNCSHLYSKLEGFYGWILHGDAVGYPINWKIDGHTEDYYFESGYIIDAWGCFDFVPLVGYSYDVIDYKLKNQHFSHTSPFVFANRNGNKSQTYFYSPYIGFYLNFSNCFCNAYDVNFSVGYNFSFCGSAHAHNKVPKFVLTDSPRTSNYGNKVNFHNLIGHDFSLSGAYKFCDNWDLSLKAEYYITYNTEKNRIKLQHNDRVVKSGQFTPTQYHVVNHAFYETYLITFRIGYSI